MNHPERRAEDGQVVSHRRAMRCTAGELGCDAIHVSADSPIGYTVTTLSYDYTVVDVEGHKELRRFALDHVRMPGYRE